MTQDFLTRFATTQDYLTRFDIYIGLSTKDTTIERELAVSNTIEPALFAAGFNSFSLEDVQGFWQGTPEDSIRVTLFVWGLGVPEGQKLEDACRRIARELNQEAVLMTRSLASGSLISAGE